ncbi:hypothetical protein B0H13DRAFT_2401475 [Mycena leptocephala]|nr:hypothetical protein B0H13DRAFT_2477417 [Mycena leptocephala]KAJ7850231.1 hypothetical protein B0H13DRAFT_2401475 [Mycena leptocephala]
MEMEEDGHDAVVFWLIFTPKRRRTSGLRVLANVTHLRIDFTLLAVLGCPRTCHAPIGRLYDRAALPHPPVPLLATITPTPAAPPIHLGSLPPRLDCISTTPTNSTSVLAHLALSRLLSSSPFILRIPLPSLSLSSGARSSSGLHGCTAITRQLHPPHSAPALVLQPLATRLTCSLNIPRCFPRPLPVAGRFRRLAALLAPRDSQYGNTAIGLAPKASGAVYSSLSSRHATTIRLFVDVAGAVVDLACHVITLEPHLSSLPTSHSLPLALRTMPAFLTAPRLPR